MNTNKIYISGINEKFSKEFITIFNVLKSKKLIPIISSINSDINKEYIKDIDYLLVILCNNQTTEQLNNMEKDYEFAKLLNKEILVFINNSVTEYTNKSDFICKMINSDNVIYWNDANDFSALLLNQINKIQNNRIELPFYSKPGMIMLMVMIYGTCILLMKYYNINHTISYIVNIFFNIALGLMSAIFLVHYISCYFKFKTYKIDTSSEYREYLKERLLYSDNDKEEEINHNIINNTNIKDKKDIIALMLKNNDETTEYFSISKGQAKFSFVFSIISCSIGIILLILSVIVALIQKQVIPTVITLISGAITEVIAGTVLWVHNKSALQLNHYYDALHENEKFLSAINLIDNLNDSKKDEVYVEVIRNQLRIKKE